MPAKPEIAGAAIVLVGNFNPLIFRPDWFVQKNILAEQEVETAVKNETIKIIHAEIVEFEVPTFRVTVERNRFQAFTATEPFIALLDLVYGTFRELPETPVSALGINREAHYSLGSEEKWHAFGDILAPKTPWNLLLGDDDTKVKTGGLKSMTMERSKRADGRPGRVQVRVEPSGKIPNGVFVHVNDHYQIAKPDEPVRAEESREILKDCFENSMEHSQKLMEHLVSLSNG